ncbi:hypothetical protein [Siccibacter turicensis]|uniref:hypothetical protein n=1 Tax=Siccibacter turicensis TaxID=357233 RepID=UPI003F542F25
MKKAAQLSHRAREARNWQGGCRFPEESGLADLTLIVAGLPQEPGSRGRSDDLYDAGRERRLELIRDIAGRMQSGMRTKP